MFGNNTSARPGRGPLVERVTGWSTRHRRTAISGWLLLVVAAVLAGLSIHGTDAHTLDPGESGRAQAQLRAHQSDDGPGHENVMIESRSDAAFTTDAAARKATGELVTALRQLPGAVANVSSPLDADGGRLLSADGHAGLVTFEVSGPAAQLEEHYDAAVGVVDRVRTHNPDARVLQAGDLSVAAATNSAYDDDLHRAELLSIPLALVILLIVFGALIAAGIPLILSLTAVLATLGLLGGIGHWVPVNGTASSMVLLIGMAVGIDYSLFYLRREREERAAGRETAEALRVTARTSGRAVAVSGVTVMLCLAGLFLTGIDVFTGIAIGTILVVGLALVGSVTVLPAILAAIGHRVDRFRIPLLGRGRTAARQSRTWSAVARAVVRRPVLLGGVAVIVLVALASPALGMRLRDPSFTDSLPRSIPTVDAAARITAAFPGDPSPAQVVVWGDDLDRPAVQQAIDGLHAQAAASGGDLGQQISSARLGEVLIVRVPLAGTGTDQASNHALETLRNKALPETLGKVAGIHFAVTGKTAGPHDFAATLHNRTPLVLTFVLGLAFLLLLVTFRSLAVPCVSLILNLLSVGAAYGVVTWVFQDGHLASLFGFTAYGGVVSWLPLFMFVVLFGLSMDYHIFILSRIRERWSARPSQRDAIVAGIASSAGVVTSAAVIMIAVFTVFVALSAVEYKMLGVGMSVAVLLDATIVRGVLLPAILSLLGDRSWTLPRILRWIPGGGQEPATPTLPAPSTAGVAHRTGTTSAEA